MSSGYLRHPGGILQVCRGNRLHNESGEAWQFIQSGKYMERTFALTLLLDAIFSAAEGADDLDWVGVLTSCSAFEAYCKVYTADLRPKQVAEFLLLNPEFPYTVRYSTERMRAALDTLTRLSSTRTASQIERIGGRGTPRWPTRRLAISCRGISIHFCETLWNSATVCTPLCTRRT